LILCTLAALVIANSKLESAYESVLAFHLGGLSLHHWVNDGLMTIFFFVIGLEIKREILTGELSSLKKAMFPVFAAIGGMIAPAIIYHQLNPSGPAAPGWGIPMATDIAFALGVLALLGKHVPFSLKVFLLSLAIVDDLGAVLVIAVFYTEEIGIAGILIMMAGVAAVVAARAFSFRSYAVYVCLGLLLWFGVLKSGVHATIAGVILGFLTPMELQGRDGKTFSPVHQLIDALHPWVAFAIMPLFALANAGVSLGGTSAVSLFENPVSLGILGGLIVGKPVGILFASFAGHFSKAASLPDNLSWWHIGGASVLGGIGFTMAIFITNISLPVEQLAQAKLGILVASCVSAVAGYAILLSATRR
jgi:NhaA family Na+:H+ antiporter